MIRRRFWLSLAIALPGLVSCTNDDAGRGSSPIATGEPAPERPRASTEESVPMSGLIAIRFVGAPGLKATNLKEYVLERIDQIGTGTLPADEVFPLPQAGVDTVRTLRGVQANVIVRWLEPLNFDPSLAAPRFGANNDFTAFFGDGWNAQAGAPPQWNGSATRGWMWVNHEYISNLAPTRSTAPTGQQLTLARTLRKLGLLANDVESSAWTDLDRDNFIKQSKRQSGGSWLRIFQDPATDEWTLDRSARNLRYDATSATLARLSGYKLRKGDVSDVGMPLPDGIVSGTAGNCSGAQTPWGTVISAEENVAGYYGDLEPAWDANQRFVTGMGFDAGDPVAFRMDAATTGEFATQDPLGRHSKETLGWLSEFDPGVAPNEYEGKVKGGVGHKKLGAIGRVRWESATFAVDGDRKLLPNKPIVLYAGDDRLGGRIFKFVSEGNWRPDMNRADTRALLDRGSVFAAHFAGLDNSKGDKLMGDKEPTEGSPGVGRWVRLGLSSKDEAPNAEALGSKGKTVADALRDPMWNGMGAFMSEDDVRTALFTVANKLGVMELNRPEKIEWNPRDPSGTPRLYVAFTNHIRQTALDQEGRLIPPKDHPTKSPKRNDEVGSIFSLQEENAGDPAQSKTFKYFVVWRGTKSADDVYSAATPDNVLIDRDGGVWFGTDGNFAVNAGRSDALYYLDLDPAHRTTMVPTFGKAFRVVAVPSDAEATGPSFTPDMRTLFLSVQHPGEDRYSAWPGR